MENRNQQNKQGQNPPRGGYISEASVFFCRGFLLLQLRTFYDRILLYKAHIK